MRTRRGLDLLLAEEIYVIVLGLVGTPAGGKSTVASRLAELGATGIDADRIAREVLERGEIRAQLTERFGVEITDETGRIDRRKLGSIVFGDDAANRAALTYLESVVHPPTRREIRQRLLAAKGRSEIAVLDIPLLFESNWHFACDEIWCVDAPLETRVVRAATRGWDAGELRRREANQVSIATKRRYSNRVIDNDGSFDELTRRIDALYHALLVCSDLPIPDPGHCQTD